MRMVCHPSLTLIRIPLRRLRTRDIPLPLGRTLIVNDDGEEEESDNFQPAYGESIAVAICRILLKYGASPHGNHFYEMRPLHIAIRREWFNLTELLLQAGRFICRG